MLSVRTNTSCWMSVGQTHDADFLWPTPCHACLTAVTARQVMTKGTRPTLKKKVGSCWAVLRQCRRTMFISLDSQSPNLAEDALRREFQRFTRCQGHCCGHNALWSSCIRLSKPTVAKISNPSPGLQITSKKPTGSSAEGIVAIWLMILPFLQTLLHKLLVMSSLLPVFSIVHPPLFSIFER